ncbi:MAG: hypothetical protein II119_04065 [Bacilli bacterium]|nr:hypothetical protein [Bacilli bacterium]
MKMIDRYGGSGLIDLVKVSEDSYDLVRDMELYVGHIILSYYDEFLKLYSEYLNEISIPNNPISKLENVSSLLWEGLFSYEDSFEYMPIESTFASKQGVDVVLGKGVCRHVSSFTTDLLLKSGTYCEDFLCFSSYSQLCETLDGNAANHQANLLKYDGNYYVYDVLSNRLLRFISPIELTDYSGECFLYYKPKLDLQCGFISLEELEMKLIGFNSSSNSIGIERKEYDEIVKETTILFARKLKLLSELKSESDKIKVKIYKGING